VSTQLFPPLAPEIEAALRASIEQFGVIVPVVQDQNGNLIDGHNRAPRIQGTSP
jgi:ParB-like chromosome segregation protein Spo0J